MNGLSLRDDQRELVVAGGSRGRGYKTAYSRHQELHAPVGSHTGRQEE